MKWYSFIFSDERSQRMQRHLLFWLLWWAYFTLSYFHYAQTGLGKIEFEPWNLPFFIKSILLLIVHAIACYYFIDFVMPRYLFTAKYLLLAAHVFLLSVVILISSYFLHREVFPLVNSVFNYTPKLANRHIWWTSITAGLLSAPKVISAAAAAKLLKRWWLKQQEKERLQKEKLITDLQLLKAQIHPEFLFSSLDSISLLTERKDIERSSMVLLKLADILSYMLYDCDNRLVPLEKEIRVIKDYLALQKIRMGERLEIDIAIKGDTGTKKITPLLLFSFIENSFTYISNQNFENSWINLEFQLENGQCTMKVIHGKAEETACFSLNGTLDNTVKRLDYFYPGNYELKSTIEPEMMMTSLKIVLEETANESHDRFYIPEQFGYAAI